MALVAVDSAQGQTIASEPLAWDANPAASPDHYSWVIAGYPWFAPLP